VLAPELVLNGLLFTLEVFNFGVELVQFDLLPLDLLVVVNELFLALLLFAFDLVKFLRAVE